MALRLFIFLFFDSLRYKTLYRLLFLYGDQAQCPAVFFENHSEIINYNFLCNQPRENTQF
jgi:hypothetical protein